MARNDQRKVLDQRRHPAYDRIVVICNATGNVVALVQKTGLAPARLVTETDDVMLQSAPNGATVRCWCSAGRHTLDVFRFQSEVFKQNDDPQARRPIRITV